MSTIPHTMRDDGDDPDQFTLAHLRLQHLGIPAGVIYRRCAACGASERWVVLRTSTGPTYHVDKRAYPEHCPVLDSL